MRIGAIVVAAGLSSRMGEFKPMLCLGENTVIEHTIESLKSAGASPIIIVTGYKAEFLTRSLSHSGVTFVHNPHFAETQMFDSVCLGLTALPETCSGVFIMPSDVPLVKQDTFKLLIGAWGKAQVVCPEFNGKTGHPLLLDAGAIPGILSYDGDNGLRGAVSSRGLTALNVSVDDEGVILDADTPDEYKKLLKLNSLRNGHGYIRMDMRLNLASDDVFLTPEIAQLLEMTEHTGSLRTACACTHMSYSKGWKTINRIEALLNFKIIESHSGGSSGGGSSLTKRGKELLNAYQQFLSETREYAQQCFKKYFPPDILKME